MSERAEVQEKVIVTKEGHYETTWNLKNKKEVENIVVKPLEFYSTTWIGSKKDMKEKYEDYYAKIYAGFIFDSINKGHAASAIIIHLFGCKVKDKEEDEINYISTLYDKYGYKIETILSELKKIFKQKTGYVLDIKKDSPYEYHIYFSGTPRVIEFQFNSFDNLTKYYHGSYSHSYTTSNIFIYDYDYVYDSVDDIDIHENINEIVSNLLNRHTNHYGPKCNVLNYIIKEDDKYPRVDFYRKFYSMDLYSCTCEHDGLQHIYDFKENKQANEQFLTEMYKDTAIKQAKENIEKFKNHCNYVDKKDDSSIMFDVISKEKFIPDYSKWLLDLEKEYNDITGTEKNVMRRCQLLEMMSAVRQFIKEERENQALNSKEKISYPYDLASIITNEEFLSKNNIVYSNYGWYLIYGTGKGQNLPLNIFSNPSNPKENDIFIVENFVKKEYEILIYKSGKFLFTSDMDKECTMDILKGFEYRGTMYAFELIKTNLIVNKFYRTAKEFTKKYL